MKPVFFTLGLAFVVFLGVSGEVSDFSSEQEKEITTREKEHQENINRQSREFKGWLNQSDAEFKKWEALRKKELQTFINQIEKLWGTYIKPSNKRWVEYSRDRSTVSSVDFEKGTVTITALVDHGADKKDITNKLSSAVARVVSSKGSKEVIPVEIEKKMQYLPTPVLAKQVVDSKGEEIVVTGVSEFAKSLVAGSEIITTPVRGTSDASSRKKIEAVLSFTLVPDHLQRRIERFLPVIERYCKKYNINKARVLATIHTESHFNPLAISSANAVGLMQLVPQSGAREAYTYVYGVDAIPKESFLYEPENNIELGCAYIYLLQSRYFSDVCDETSRQYCSIAAYNTGPKNVAYAFIKKRDLRKAITVINSLDNAKKVYNKLIERLPYRETRHYLARVTERMGLYKNQQ